jgi:hypothetical protein
VTFARELPELGGPATSICDLVNAMEQGDGILGDGASPCSVRELRRPWVLREGPPPAPSPTVGACLAWAGSSPWPLWEGASESCESRSEQPVPVAGEHLQPKCAAELGTGDVFEELLRAGAREGIRWRSTRPG